MTETRTESSGPRRAAYLVLGMHRSGTSATAQLLAKAGAGLPEHVMPGDQHNAKGYFEPWRIANLNNRRLQAADSAWDDVFAFPQAPLPINGELAWIQQGQALFCEEYGTTPLPLLKDPRVSVLMPYWAEVLRHLDIEPRIVIPVRHPLAVAGSLAKRNGFPVEKSVLLWTSYMLASEAYSRGLPRVFVSYDNLLADWRGQLGRIEAAHGAAMPGLTKAGTRDMDRFLTPKLNHNDGAGEMPGLDGLGSLISGFHESLVAAANDRELDGAAVSAVASAVSDLKARVGTLVSPVTRDLDLVRIQLLDLQQKVAFDEGQRVLNDPTPRIEALEAELAGMRAERAELEQLISQALSTT